MGVKNIAILIYYNSNILCFFLILNKLQFGKAMCFVYHVKFLWKYLSWISSKIYNSPCNA